MTNPQQFDNGNPIGNPVVVQDDQGTAEFDSFVALTSNLLSVSKKQLDEARAKEGAAR